MRSVALFQIAQIDIDRRLEEWGLGQGDYDILLYKEHWEWKLGRGGGGVVTCYGIENTGNGS